MSKNVFFRSDLSDLLLYYYPIIQEAKYELTHTEKNLENFQHIAQNLYVWHLLKGDSAESTRMQRLWDAGCTIDSMRILCRDHQTQEVPPSKEKSFVFLAADPQDLTIQSFAHAFFDKEAKKIKIGHLFTAPWNNPNSFSAQMPRKCIRGAGTFISEHAISIMHSDYPTHEIQVETPRSAVPFFRKKLGFQVVDKSKETTTLSLSKTKAGGIAAKVFKALKK